MIGTGHQVGWLIVLAIEVFVVNFFFRSQCSTERRLNNNDMLKHIALRIRSRMCWHQYLAIPFLENEGFSSVKARAFHRAEFRSPMFSRGLTAAKAGNRGSFLPERFARLRWWSIGKLQIMLPTIALAEMNSDAGSYPATKFWARRLSLFGKSSSALPSAVASRIAKVSDRIAIFLGNHFVAVGTVIFIHCLMISKTKDANHFSLSWSGIR
jgi:hypothetical protein